ncbi:hypothetical protein J2X46_002911 [Nocardioides sp. BE266]|uniref:type IV toxin-antitoxin system AbiEi family antitoxin domain-containing protein n=1 Tax=Nocardioides sp. BE266 TaxID=2817725 RepID=UPI00285CDAD7|nr:type IV toxin-antitoxin system AbiEi family antitoxin domain-containing protein [Nocardioides sp. BE266]MDR7253921.1 hypothetical protein [Nocardioides sp. BE266]
MYLPAFALMHRQHGLISHRQLAALGLVRGEIERLVRSGRLVRVRRGVYADGEAWEAAEPYRARPLLRVRAAAISLRAPSYVFSHDSSSIALGMGAPSPTTALVHISRHKVHGDAERAGIKHHRAPFREQDASDVEGLRMLGPARTALDMAREHGRAPGLAACDAALRGGVTREQMTRVLDEMSCWPGSTIMRWCIEHADPGAESYLESQGRELVLELGIGRPRTQLGLGDGRREVWIDFHVGRQMFEVDGLGKYPDDPVQARAALRREKDRQDFISGFKVGVARITAYDCGPGRAAALARLRREHDETCRLFGTAIDDLAPFILAPERRRLA